jgi:hypothetical protein
MLTEKKKTLVMHTCGGTQQHFSKNAEVMRDMK